MGTKSHSALSPFEHQAINYLFTDIYVHIRYTPIENEYGMADETDNYPSVSRTKSFQMSDLQDHINFSYQLDEKLKEEMQDDYPEGMLQNSMEFQANLYILEMGKYLTNPSDEKKLKYLCNYFEEQWDWGRDEDFLFPMVRADVDHFKIAAKYEANNIETFKTAFKIFGRPPEYEDPSFFKNPYINYGKVSETEIQQKQQLMSQPVINNNGKLQLQQKHQPAKKLIIDNPQSAIKIPGINLIEQDFDFLLKSENLFKQEKQGDQQKNNNTNESKTIQPPPLLQQQSIQASNFHKDQFQTQQEITSPETKIEPAPKRQLKNFLHKDSSPKITQISPMDLSQKCDAANKLFQRCSCCGRDCFVNRSEVFGKCGTGMYASVAEYFPHFGEEKCLIGVNGSGTVFFTNCELKCIYCNTHEISQGYMPQFSRKRKNLLGMQYFESEQGEGLLSNTLSRTKQYLKEKQVKVTQKIKKEQKDVEIQTDEALADILIELQDLGCHNINFVSPTHVVAPILRAVRLAKEDGFELPIIYNSGGYDSKEALQLLDGVVDIYLPDMKYSDDRIALKFSNIPNYTNVNRLAVREMHRQVGDLKFDKDGLAKSGLLIRHLVLPENYAGSAEVANFIANKVSVDTYVNVMKTYEPKHYALKHKLLNRRATEEEYTNAVTEFKNSGIYRLQDEWNVLQELTNYEQEELRKKSIKRDRPKMEKPSKPIFPNDNSRFLKKK